MIDKKKFRLAYIVTEQGCMCIETGAFNHIKNGIRELSKHFNLITFLPEKIEKSKQFKDDNLSIKLKWYQQTGLWGMLRDIRDFIKNFKQSISIKKRLIASNCKIAYIRVQGLHPLPFILKKSGISVFLEANGLQFENRQQLFYSSWLSWLYKPFERLIYKIADHVFFVGSYGQYWKLNSDNWSEVENGVEIELFPRREFPSCSKLPLKLAFLAKPVAHHRLDLLEKALNNIPKEFHKNLELHLIGNGLSDLSKKILPTIKTINHGFVKRKELGNLLTKMDIGLIPGGPLFNSQMKLMDYAAAGCLVVAANIDHLNNFYKENGICFFKNGSALSLRNKIILIMKDKINITKEANKLHVYVKNTFQWYQIFNTKAERILTISKIK